MTLFNTHDAEAVMPKLPKDPNQMLICEIYQSIQGEGTQMGLPTVFVRVTGCPLRCRWCDEPRALSEGTVMTLDDIKERIGAYPTKNVCLTGGEPLAHKQAGTLMRTLADDGFSVTVETSGALPIDELPRIPGITISMDIKCPSSGMQDRMKFENLGLLRLWDQVKFVIADRTDYEYAKKVIDERNTAATVVFQPEGGREMLPLVDWVLQDGLNVRVLPQLHKIIWRDKRGV